MATAQLRSEFFADVKRRSARAVQAVASHVGAAIRRVLLEAGGGAGRRYDFYKGHLYPLDTSNFGRSSMGADGTVRFFTRGGKVIPMAEPVGGWKVRGRIHQASARGQSPRALTTTLAKSVAFAVRLIGGADVVARLGPSGASVKYARWLEEDMKRPAWVSTLKAEWPTSMEIYRETYGAA